MAKIGSASIALLRPEFEQSNKLITEGLDGLVKSADPLKTAIDGNLKYLRDDMLGQLKQVAQQSAPLNPTDPGALSEYIQGINNAATNLNAGRYGINANTLVDVNRTGIVNRLADQEKELKNEDSFLKNNLESGKQKTNEIQNAALALFPNDPDGATSYMLSRMVNEGIPTNFTDKVQEQQAAEAGIYATNMGAHTSATGIINSDEVAMNNLNRLYEFAKSQYGANSELTRMIENIAKSYGSGGSGKTQAPVGGSASAGTSPSSGASFSSLGADVAEVVEAGNGYTTLKLADGRVVTAKGDRNFRNNNFGNISYGKFAKKYGAVGSDGRFAVFKNAEDGMRAMQGLLFESDSYKGRTLSQAIARYSPSSENNTAGYTQRVLEAVGGRDIPMSQYSAAERKAIVDTMISVEGRNNVQYSVSGGGSTGPRPLDELVTSKKILGDRRNRQSAEKAYDLIQSMAPYMDSKGNFIEKHRESYAPLAAEYSKLKKSMKTHLGSSYSEWDKSLKNMWNSVRADSKGTSQTNNTSKSSTPSVASVANSNTPSAPPMPQVDPSTVIKYSNKNATRNKPLNDKVANNVAPVLAKHGLTWDVNSGGQDPKGKTVGSSAHNHGMAGDGLLINSKTGKPLSFTKDQGLIADLVEDLAAAGFTGIGGHVDYMGDGRMHIGMQNKVSVWGGTNGDAHTKNLYPWMKEAFERGRRRFEANGGQAVFSGGGGIAGPNLTSPMGIDPEKLSQLYALGQAGIQNRQGMLAQLMGMEGDNPLSRGSGMAMPKLSGLPGARNKQKWDVVNSTLDQEKSLRDLIYAETDSAADFINEDVSNLMQENYSEFKNFDERYAAAQAAAREQGASTLPLSTIVRDMKGFEDYLAKDGLTKEWFGSQPFAVQEKLVETFSNYEDAIDKNNYDTSESGKKWKQKIIRTNHPDKMYQPKYVLDDIKDSVLNPLAMKAIPETKSPAAWNIFGQGVDLTGWFWQTTQEKRKTNKVIMDKFLNEFNKELQTQWQGKSDYKEIFTRQDLEEIARTAFNYYNAEAETTGENYFTSTDGDKLGNRTLFENSISRALQTQAIPARERRNEAVGRTNQYIKPASEVVNDAIFSQLKQAN